MAKNVTKKPAPAQKTKPYNRVYRRVVVHLKLEEIPTDPYNADNIRDLIISMLKETGRWDNGDTVEYVEFPDGVYGDLTDADLERNPPDDI